MRQFDASIDLTTHTVPAGLQSAVAIARVHSAVQAVDGAGWVSVEWCGDAPARLPWLRVYQPGDGRAKIGGEWDAIASLVRLVRFRP